MSLVAASLPAAAAFAEPSLQLQPLQYQEALQKGERKKGFIDITNPTSQAMDVSLEVQSFRQVDNQGSLSFSDSEQLRNGIQLDYDRVQIPARQTLRLFFVIDGAKLPKGDVFAVIFARTVADTSPNVSSSVRLGTLLLLTNETPGARQAELTEFTIPLLQVGTALMGQLAVKNTAPPQSSSGFYPQITISLWPFGPRYDITAPFTYAGNIRQVSLNEVGDMFGIYKVSATTGTSHKERWVVLVTGIWRWISVVAVVFLAGIILFVRRRLRRRAA